MTPPSPQAGEAIRLSAEGLRLREGGDLAQALALQLRALQLAPENWGIRLNAAVAWQDLGFAAEALRELNVAVPQSGQNPLAVTNLGMAQLRQGNGQQGFRDYYQRWFAPGWTQQPYSVPFPHLAPGQKPAGRWLVLPDQGFGDTLLALPWLRWLARRQGEWAVRLVVVVRPPLLGLLRLALADLAVQVDVRAEGEFSGWLTSLDIPAVFPESVDAYEAERREIEECWRAALTVGCTASNNALGVVWRGSPEHGLDRWRSFTPGDLLRGLRYLPSDWKVRPLLPDIRSDEQETLSNEIWPGKLEIVDLADFAATARSLLTCNALLTADTACAHLAGLLGVPTLVWLNALGDWRWGDGGMKAPYYPTVRVLRQTDLGDWRGCIRQTAQWLGQYSGEANRYAWRRPGMLNIVALSMQKQAGVVEARVDYPMRMLATLPDIQVLFGANVQIPPDWVPGMLILHRQMMKDERFVADVEQLVAKGWTVVADMDDDPHHWRGFVDTDFYAYRGVHAVTVSTEPLAQMIRQWNPNVRVFPNAIYDLPQVSHSTPKLPGKIRVFFGALNRGGDWASLMASYIAAAQKLSGVVEFVVVHDKVFFDALPEGVAKKFYATLPHDKYMTVMASCDVALLPLSDNQFNRLKSDLKFIECCAAGVVPICSPVVYGEQSLHHEIGVFAESPRDWQQALVGLCSDTAEIHRRRLLGLDYVKRERMHARQMPEREEYYRWLSNNRMLLEAQRQTRLSNLKSVGVI